MSEGFVDSFLTFQSRTLNSGPVAHNHILNTPTDACVVIAGGTLERWAVLSPNTLPGDPCDLFFVGKCKVSLNKEQVEDCVRWIGCDGPCRRWFHSTVCLEMSEDEVRKIGIVEELTVKRCKDCIDNKEIFLQIRESVCSGATVQGYSLKR